MAEYLIQDTTLDAIADAINAKTGGSSAMTPAEMVTAIGSISGGGGEQGLFDLAFNYTDRKGNTISGAVEDNAVINFSATAGWYSPPLLLKQPIVINPNDVIEVTFSNINVGGTGLNFSDVSLVTPIYFTVEAGAQKINVAVNFFFPTSGSVTKSFVYSENSAIINAIFVTSRVSPASAVSFEVHLSINGVQLF